MSGSASGLRPIQYETTTSSLKWKGKAARRSPEIKMHEEPKSMLRYVAIALVLVVPTLYFISAHVDKKVAPVSGFIAQTLVVTPGNSQLATADKSEIK